MNSLKKSYFNIFLFDLINQNYNIIFKLGKLDLTSDLLFYLSISKFDNYDKDIFDSFFFLEWLSGFKPFFLKDKLICSLRSNYLYNFLIYFDFFLIKYDNIKILSQNLDKNSIEFEIKSFRKIPFLPSRFYNFQSKIICTLSFSNFYYYLSNPQKLNFLIFLFNIKNHALYLL